MSRALRTRSTALTSASRPQSLPPLPLPTSLPLLPCVSQTNSRSRSRQKPVSRQRSQTWVSLLRRMSLLQLSKSFLLKYPLMLLMRSPSCECTSSHLNPLQPAHEVILVVCKQRVDCWSWQSLGKSTYFMCIQPSRTHPIQRSYTRASTHVHTQHVYTQHVHT